MFSVDTPFPKFSLEVYLPDKDEVGRITNEDFKSAWLVLFYYPADFTFVCPTELADLNRHHGEFTKLGARIVAVSTDTVYTHKGWIEAEKLLTGLRFPMAADHNGRFSRELGILNEEKGLAQRAAFIVDPDGVLRAVDIVSKNIGRSVSELVRKVKALRFVHTHEGKVCPASWDEGAPTLSPSIKIAGKIYKELNGS